MRTYVASGHTAISIIIAPCYLASINIKVNVSDGNNNASTLPAINASIMKKFNIKLNIYNIRDCA